MILNETTNNSYLCLRTTCYFIVATAIRIASHTAIRIASHVVPQVSVTSMNNTKIVTLRIRRP